MDRRNLNPAGESLTLSSGIRMIRHAFRMSYRMDTMAGSSWALRSGKDRVGKHTEPDLKIAEESRLVFLSCHPVVRFCEPNVMAIELNRNEPGWR